MEDAMATSAVGAHVYESVRRRSPIPIRQRRTAGPALLPMWLALVVRVVVVGGLAFGSGFLGVIVLRALGWALAGARPTPGSPLPRPCWSDPSGGAGG
jgi:hypothetical protein